MTGKEFKTIRLWNNITYKDMNNIILTWNAKNNIYMFEQKSMIPERFVKILSDMIGTDLTNEKKFQKTLTNAIKGIRANRKVMPTGMLYE